jgi:hypothetical protein
MKLLTPLSSLLVRRLRSLGHALLNAPRMVVPRRQKALLALPGVAPMRPASAGPPAVQAAPQGPLPDPVVAEPSPAVAGPETPPAARRRLGEILLARRALSERDLEQALQLQQATGLSLGEVLRVAGLVPADDIAAALGEQMAMTTVHPEASEVARALLARLPEELAEELQLLPLSIDAQGAARVAFAAEPGPELQLLVEQALGRKIVPLLASAAALSRARRRAYRRPHSTRLQTLPLGAELVASGQLQANDLRAALAEQRKTGERLGDVLVRKRLVEAGKIAQALDERGADVLGYCRVAPEEVDIEGLMRLGYGLCAFYGLVPLRGRPPGHTVALASAFPLHPEVVRACARRLGTTPQAVLAPSLDVRLALAAGSCDAWPVNLGEAVGGLDGAELRALASEPSLVPELMSLARRARRAGQSPIDHLETAGRLSAFQLSRLRAHALGLTMFVRRPGAPSPPAAATAGLLPPGLVERHGLHLRQRDDRSMLLAAPRPTPALAAEVAALFPSVAIGWQVLASGQLRVLTERPEQADADAATPSLAH